MKKIFALLFFAIFATSSFIYAQQEKGDKIISFSVSFSKAESSDDGNLTLNLKYGKFLTQNFELGFTPTIYLAGGITTADVGLYGNYNFLTEGSKAVPYIGAKAGVYLIEPKVGESVNAFTYGLNGGIRYFFTEKANIDTSLTYSSISFDQGSQSLIMLNIGLGIIIGSLK